MHKMQVEEMSNLFCHKMTYEETSAILQTRHRGIRGYSVKSIKGLCKKMEFLPGSLKTMCEQ